MIPLLQQLGKKKNKNTNRLWNIDIHVYIELC